MNKLVFILTVTVTLAFCNCGNEEPDSELCNCYNIYLEMYKDYDFEVVEDRFQFELDFQKQHGQCTELFFKEAESFINMSDSEIISYDDSLRTTCSAYKEVMDLKKQDEKSNLSPLAHPSSY